MRYLHNPQLPLSRFLLYPGLNHLKSLLAILIRIRSALFSSDRGRILQFCKSSLRDSSMKRALASDDAPSVGDKKMKNTEIEEEVEATGFMNLDENLLYEVLKHVDARTLGVAACVNKQWHKTAQDERLWELICTRQCPNIGCANQQLRSVVLALGGFRHLHSLYLWPLFKPPNKSPFGSSPLSSPFPMIPSKPSSSRWGKDEVNLSLSLFSIRYYEKMNLSKRGR